MVYTICGSMRFQQQMREAAARLELDEGCVVIQCVYFPEGQGPTPQQAEALNRLHLAKIDLSDGIFVVNVGGYVGEQTRREIDYAMAHGKDVRYLVAMEG